MSTSRSSNARRRTSPNVGAADGITSWAGLMQTIFPTPVQPSDTISGHLLWMWTCGHWHGRTFGDGLHDLVGDVTRVHAIPHIAIYHALPVSGSCAPRTPGWAGWSDRFPTPSLLAALADQLAGLLSSSTSRWRLNISTAETSPLWRQCAYSASTARRSRAPLGVCGRAGTFSSRSGTSKADSCSRQYRSISWDPLLSHSDTTTAA